MRDYKKLMIWERSHALTLDIYKITKSFPKDELYGLTSQIRRAAVSIPTNMAEGSGRDSEVDFKRYLQISMGSACELEYLIFLSNCLEYISEETYEKISTEIESIKKMISSFITKIRK